MLRKNSFWDTLYFIPTNINVTLFQFESYIEFNLLYSSITISKSHDINTRETLTFGHSENNSHSRKADKGTSHSFQIILAF